MLAATQATAHSDIFLANVGGQVAVGGANELESASPFFELDTQVFEAVLVTGFPLPLFDYGRGEPGFFALPSNSLDLPAGSAALVGNADVSVQLPTFSVGGNSASLFYWDGSGAIDFQPVGATQPGVTLAIDPTPLSDPTGSDGSLHFHPAYELNLAGAGAPADGVYLAAPTVSVAGMAASKPFYLVLLADQLLVDDDAAEGLEETLESGNTFYEAVGKDFGFYEEAVEYVQANVAVPEPTTALMAMGIAASLSGLRTRHCAGGRPRR
ncbi:MAG: hypothetical protein AB7G28_10730 [Pirellulales bacterium]